VIAALLVASFWPQEPWPSRFVYAAGENAVYDVRMSYVSGEESEVSEEIWTYRLLEVNEVGQARIELKRNLAALVVDGTRHPIEAGEPTVTTEWRSPRGEVRNRRTTGPAPEEEERLLRWLDVRWPGGAVEPGDPWGWKVEAGDLPAIEFVGQVMNSASGRQLQTGFDEAARPLAHGTVTRHWPADEAPSVFPRRMELKVDGAILPGDEERLPQTLSAVWIRR